MCLKMLSWRMKEQDRVPQVDPRVLVLRWEVGGGGRAARVKKMQAHCDIWRVVFTQGAEEFVSGVFVCSGMTEGLGHLVFLAPLSPRLDVKMA